MQRKVLLSEIGVVIQGPIQSFGRTLTDLNPRAYDATGDIKSTFKEIENLGAGAVVITWSKQDISSFSELEKKKIVQIGFPKKNILRVLRNDWNGNSKYRQYYSTLRGLQELKKNGYKYILKLRTDNLVDVRSLFEFLENLDASVANSYMFTPLINLDKPHMFYDFYAFGSLVKMEEFCNVILYQKERTTNVHFDVFFRWSKYVTGSKFTLRDINLIYPKYPTYTKNQLEFMRNSLAMVFRPLPKNIWTSLYWRGEMQGDVALKDQYRFSEDTVSMILSDFDSTKYELRKKINMNYQSILSYFLTSRIEIHLFKFSAKLGGAKRKLLQLLRKIFNR